MGDFVPRKYKTEWVPANKEGDERMAALSSSGWYLCRTELCKGGAAADVPLGWMTLWSRSS